MSPWLYFGVGVFIGTFITTWCAFDSIDRALLAKDPEHRAELEALAAEPAERPTSNAQLPAPNSPEALDALIIASRFLPQTCPLTPPIVVACGAEDRAALERFWKLIRNLEDFLEDT